ncbi:MAG: FixH family protein [Cyclobacteriaceae bacterium]|nr:FixH family protein [Cyclobacteriaceae bacterium]
MNWGKSIALAFVLFAVFIGVLVVVCIRQDIPLVAEDYYQQELMFQEQIDRMRNTSALPEKPIIGVIGTEVEIRFVRLSDISEARLELFRPSSKSMDRTFVLTPAEGGRIRMNVSNMASGMYRAKMRWSMDGKPYYLEQVIYL